MGLAGGRAIGPALLGSWGGVEGGVHGRRHASSLLRTDEMSTSKKARYMMYSTLCTSRLFTKRRPQLPQLLAPRWRRLGCLLRPGGFCSPEVPLTGPAAPGRTSCTVGIAPLGAPFEPSGCPFGPSPPSAPPNPLLLIPSEARAQDKGPESSRASAARPHKTATQAMLIIAKHERCKTRAMHSGSMKFVASDLTAWR